MDAQAENTTGQVIGTVSPFLSAIPYVGPILSAAGAIGSGLLEKDAAKKQQEQAASLRTQANQLQKEPIRPELLAKAAADRGAAQAGLPGLEMYKGWLEQNMAQHIRAIRESSPSGAAAVNAISSALGKQNQALETLGAKNAEYKAGREDVARQDLWDLGLQQRGLEMDRNKERSKMLGQVNALEASGTANKQTGWNTVLGAAGSTVSNIFRNMSDPNYMKYLQGNSFNPNGGSWDGVKMVNGYPVAVNPTAQVSAKFDEPTQNWGAGAGNFGGSGNAMIVNPPAQATSDYNIPFDANASMGGEGFGY